MTYRQSGDPPLSDRKWLLPCKLRLWTTRLITRELAANYFGMCADNQSLREDDTLMDMVPSIDAISTHTAELKSEPDRPAKRPRLEPSPSPSSAATASCTRHPQFWHADGSVILQVSQTLFRLHASQLKKQSTFFADLLKEDGNSQPAAAVDGCPLHRIANVSVQDMERLLGALDNGL